MSDQLTCPDLLQMADGSSVADADAWPARRAELLALLQDHEYGRLPAPPAEPVRATVLFEDRNWLGEGFVLKEVEVTHTPGAPSFRMLLAAPGGGGAPAFVGHNFHGNHTLTVDPRVALPTGFVRETGPGAVNNRATEAGRGGAVSHPLALIVARGYAVASFYHGDFRPDRPDLPGIEQHMSPRTDAGTIAIWAWGLHRAVDALQDEPLVDPARIAAIGHSRLGKTALLAGATDERIAAVIDVQSGCSGSAPARTGGAEGVETVAVINQAFPHWFNETYKSYNDRPADLPFDQHALLSLIAPRPLLVATAEADVWANPPGAFAMCRLADPVYRMLSGEGLDAEAMPAPDALVPSRLGFAIRRGGHKMGPEDWTFFLAFADRWL